MLNIKHEKFRIQSAENIRIPVYTWNYIFITYIAVMYPWRIANVLAQNLASLRIHFAWGCKFERNISKSETVMCIKCVKFHESFSKMLMAKRCVIVVAPQNNCLKPIVVIFLVCTYTTVILRTCIAKIQHHCKCAELCISYFKN